MKTISRFLAALALVSLAALGFAEAGPIAPAPFAGLVTNSYSSNGLLLQYQPIIPFFANTETYGLGWKCQANAPGSSVSGSVMICNDIGLTISGAMGNVTGSTDMLAFDCDTTFSQVTSGPVTTAGGCQDGLYVDNTNAGITFSALRGHVVHNENNSADTVSLWDGIQIIFTNNAGTISNFRGLDLSGVQNIPGGGSITNGWSLYSSNPALTLFNAGTLAIGSPSSPVPFYLNGSQLVPNGQAYLSIANAAYGGTQGNHTTGSTTASGSCTIGTTSGTSNSIAPGATSDSSNANIPNGATVLTTPGNASVTLSLCTTGTIASGTSLKWNNPVELCPYGGQNLVINGYVQQIPTSCSFLVANGLASGSLYYVYASTQNFTVSGTAADANQGNAVQLTVNATTNLASLDQCAVSGVNGTTEANGTWQIILINSTTIDLKGSNYSHTYTSGGTINCPVTLSASATGHVTTNGIETESGNSAYSLVGMVYTVGSNPYFEDSNERRYVLSWFNPQIKKSIATVSSSPTASGTSYSELSSSFENDFLIWGPTGNLGPLNETVAWRVSGAVNNGTLGDGCLTSVGVDGTTNQTEQQEFVQPVAGYDVPLGLDGRAAGLSEGKHYITLLGATLTGGTCTWNHSFTSLSVDNTG